MTKEEIRKQGKEDFKRLQVKLNDYARSQGGIHNIQESSNGFNDIQREIIKAFAQKHYGDKVYLIDYNQEEIIYNGEFVPNFGCESIQSDLEIYQLLWF